MDRPFTARANRRPLELIDSRSLESLRVFHEVARSLTSSLDLDTLLRAIMARMEQFFGPEHWSLLLVDEATDELYYALFAGMDESNLKGLRLPIGEGVAGQVAATGQPLIVPDVTSDPAWARYNALHPEFDLQSIACLPIRHGDRTLGVLQLNNSRIDLLSESAASFLRVLCDYAAIALENARHIRLVEQLSITDDCTGLFNARHLYTLLEQEIANAQEAAKDPRDQRNPRNPRVVSIQPSHFSLLFFDLDHFKSVNDRYGHLSGSLLLAEIGGVLKRALGPTHAAFRYGGDEFVALLHGLDKAAAIQLTQQVRAQLLEAPYLTGQGLGLTVTASFGLATYPQDGHTLHDLIRSADTMMYVAKSEGRNRIAVADSEHPTQIPASKVSRHS